jgi:endothelin-converting enzyme
LVQPARAQFTLQSLCFDPICSFTDAFADPEWQEYYEDESIRKIYQDVVERLLSSLAEKNDTDLPEEKTRILIQQDGENVWPPWPWPPWGDDDGKTPKPDKPESHHELAKKVLKFETQIANASLDLYVIIIFLASS